MAEPVALAKLVAPTEPVVSAEFVEARTLSSSLVCTKGPQRDPLFVAYVECLLHRNSSGVH